MKLKPAIPIKLPLKTLDWASLIPHIGTANRSLADYNGMLRHLRNASFCWRP